MKCGTSSLRTTPTLMAMRWRTPLSGSPVPSCSSTLTSGSAMVEVGTAAMFAVGQAASVWEWRCRQEVNTLVLGIFWGVVRAAVSAISGDAIVGIRTAPWGHLLRRHGAIGVSTHTYTQVAQLSSSCSKSIWSCCGREGLLHFSCTVLWAQTYVGAAPCSCMAVSTLTCRMPQLRISSNQPEKAAFPQS